MIAMTLDNPCLKAVSMHYVGSKNNLEALHISQDPLELDSDSIKLLKDGFLHKFKTIPEQYSFHHADSLQFNEVFTYCQQLFNDPSKLTQVSASIARHLYQAST